MIYLQKILTALRLLAPYIAKLLATSKTVAPAAQTTALVGLNEVSQSTVATEWAKAWADSGKPTEDLAMIVWFSKAIMAGYEAGATYTRAYPASEAAASVPTKEDYDDRDPQKRRQRKFTPILGRTGCSTD